MKCTDEKWKLKAIQTCRFEGKKTKDQATKCRRISGSTLTFIAGVPQTDFDTKLVNFLSKLVLPVILKELQSNFLICALRLFQKLSHK